MIMILIMQKNKYIIYFHKNKIDIDLNISILCKSITMSLTKIENVEAFRENIRKQLDKFLQNEKNIEGGC